MQVHLIKLRLSGVALRKSEILDRFHHGKIGELSLRETSDHGLHRLSRVARFEYGDTKQYSDTLTVHALWQQIKILNFQAKLRNFSSGIYVPKLALTKKNN